MSPRTIRASTGPASVSRFRAASVSHEGKTLATARDVAAPQTTPGESAADLPGFGKIIGGDGPLAWTGCPAEMLGAMMVGSSIGDKTDVVMGFRPTTNDANAVPSKNIAITKRTGHPCPKNRDTDVSFCPFAFEFGSPMSQFLDTHVPFRETWQSAPAAEPDLSRLSLIYRGATNRCDGVGVQTHGGSRWRHRSRRRGNRC